MTITQGTTLEKSGPAAGYTPQDSGGDNRGETTSQDSDEVRGLERDSGQRPEEIKNAPAGAGSWRAPQDSGQRPEEIKKREIRFLRARDMESPLDRAIREMALERPDLGEVSVARVLSERGLPVKSGYVHQFWKKHGLSTLRQRFDAVHAYVKRTGLPLAGARKAAEERAFNRLMAAGKLPGVRPGVLVAVDTLFLGEIPDGTEVCLQTAVDSYSGYAFALPHEKHLNPYDISLAAVRLVYEDVVPFLEARGLRLERVLTDRSPAYCYGHRPVNEFESLLAQLGVAHDITQGSNPGRNGLSACFHAVVQREFFRAVTESGDYGTIDRLVPAFTDWLEGYNTRRAGTDERYFGRTPAECLLAGTPQAVDGVGRHKENAS